MGVKLSPAAKVVTATGDDAGDPSRPELQEFPRTPRCVKIKRDRSAKASLSRGVLVSVIPGGLCCSWRCAESRLQANNRLSPPLKSEVAATIALSRFT